MKKLFLLLLLLWQYNIFAQSDSLQNELFQLNAGLSINPQQLFIGSLDMGVGASIESQPANNYLSVLVAADFRNRWFTVPIAENAGTKGLKTHYALTGLGSAGIGICFFDKTFRKKNAFYFIVAPRFYLYKETVDNEYFENTVSRNTTGVNYGLTWSNTVISKKGKRIHTQFYLPLFGGHFLDEMKYMNLRIGLQLFK